MNGLVTGLLRIVRGGCLGLLATLVVLGAGVVALGEYEHHFATSPEPSPTALSLPSTSTSPSPAPTPPQRPGFELAPVAHWAPGRSSSVIDLSGTDA